MLESNYKMWDFIWIHDYLSTETQEWLEESDSEENEDEEEEEEAKGAEGDEEKAESEEESEDEKGKGSFCLFIVLRFSPFFYL